MVFNKKMELTFKKIPFQDIPLDRTYYVYGDSIHESIEIMEWFLQFNSDRLVFKELAYISLGKYVYIFNIGSKQYYFIVSGYYHGGSLPNKVTKLITNLDKPDAVLYSPTDDKVIMGFETTATTLAGNATWQRFGRTIQFMKDGIPFAYLAYSSKLDQSQSGSSNKARTASALFVLDFISLSMKYGTPALVGFFNHFDPVQKRGVPIASDYLNDIFEYLYDLLFDPEGVSSSLKSVLYNMCQYYRFGGVVPDDEFDKDLRTFILSEEFLDQLTLCLLLRKKYDYALFNQTKILAFKWKPKKFTGIIHEMFPATNFYQLSKNCKAGICFNTQSLIEEINKCNLPKNCVTYFDRIDEPTIIIPTKLTKKNKGRIVATDDPYNGEISAFSEIYKQSWPNANIMLLLLDHSNNNEYSINNSSSRKIYKSICDYSNIVIDLSKKIQRIEHTKPDIIQTIFTSIFVTEDNVTCFFETILLRHNITPSFINPPCGSWSDFRLLPTKKFYYYKRNDIRADIAFFLNGTYFIGESKESYRKLKTDGILSQFEKVKKVESIIKKNISLTCKYKKFVIFAGNEIEAKAVLSSSGFDLCCILLDDDEKITFKIV